MKQTLPRLCLLPPASRFARAALILCLCCSAGCTSVNMNPAYFPYLFPTPYANYDPDLVRIELQPTEKTLPVGTQHALLVGVYDKNNVTRRGRQVEFMINGAGSIIDVAPTCALWRNKPDQQYAITSTACFEHKVSRGTGSLDDDFVVKPGYTWCVLSAPVEGDTHVTVYAPGIHNWDKRLVHTTIHWVDAAWEFPTPAQVRAGTAHVLTTRLVRHTDKKPLAHYSVRYRIEGGGAGAVFLPGRTQEFTAVSDLSGLAQVPVMETVPILGATKISIEVIRPPDPAAPGGTGLTIARGETYIDWLAAAVSLTDTGPPLALLGADVTYETVVSNTGKVDSTELTVSGKVPDGLKFVSSEPPPTFVEVLPGSVESRTLKWALPPLPPGMSHRPIRTTYRTERQGPMRHCMDVTTAEGLKDEKCTTTTVSTGALKVSVSGPPTALLGQPIIFDIVIANPGAGPLDNVLVMANFSTGLEYKKGTFAPLKLEGITALPGQNSRSETLELIARQPGPQTLKITATAGLLSDQAEATVNVLKPQVSLAIDGEPPTKYVGRPAEWRLTVANAGAGVLSNVVVRDRLPRELEFVSADQGGEVKDGEVQWNVAQLQAGEKRVLKVTTLARHAGKGLIHSATASAGPDLKADAQVKVDIVSTPASPELKVLVAGDPVAVGKTVTYTIRVANTGQTPLDQVELKVVLPPELKLVSAKGPPGVKQTAAGQTIDFARKDFVEQDNPLEYRIEAQAMSPGDTRFRVELRVQGKEPILRVESTKIYE